MSEGQGMSEEGVQGLILRSPAATYFVPESDLQAYRLPDDVASQLRERFEDEVSGFAMPGKNHRGPHLAEIVSVTWNPKFEPDVSHIMLHTATRM